MRYARLPLFAAALVAGPAHGDPTLLDHWDTGAVVEDLRALGATEILVGQDGAAPSVIARTTDGLSVGLFARACRPPTSDGASADCRGLEGVISYDIRARADRAALPERLNHRFVAGKYMLDASGALRLSRYVGLEGGVSGENLRAELRDFFVIGATTAATLWPSAPAAPRP